MTLALDAVGGDKAPCEPVKGAVDAARELGVHVALVGPSQVVEKELARLSTRGLALSVIDAPEVVEMGEHPSQALKQKRNSSIAVGTGLVKKGEASAFVSAGNTGAVVVYGLFTLGMMKDVERPALATLFSTLKGRAMILDVGATAECKPAYLLQFAQLGSIYSELVLGVARPRVGLLNIGEEETKGTRLFVEAHQLLKQSALNFVGNVEGKEVLRGDADVVVTDGFTGNVATKVAEGLSEALFISIKQAVTRDLRAKLGALLIKPALMSVADQWDYRRVGGAPLLGVQGNVVVSHGRSDALAVKNALGLAKRAVQEDWLRKFEERR
ncbi:MAG: phosphate acyltransferase PlsX [Chloroflexi bacterium]|nr:phosphate acyltransferase PlsX [Chloroflexota bacterium]